MALVRCMPENTVIKIRNVALRDRHPGLVLDKPTDAPERQEDQREAVENIVETQGDPELLRTVNDKRTRLLNTLDVGSWNARTVGSMTIHLARASALENAGICLHPIYGFVYLPGSGLKGMARAYAETIWKEAQNEVADAKRRIIEVFGNDSGEPNEKKQRAGAIVFHDAWPVAWPKLVCDILNNHHRDYYDGKGEPGDWENPLPVYFLAVENNTEFNFAVSKRRNDVSDRLRDLAKEWLSGALYYLGAGAKTNAGYGTFVPVDGERPTMDENETHKTFEKTLEFTTPAFIGNAVQGLDEVALRGSSLKGILRFWWRAMHGDWTTERLLEQEGRIFGDTETGAGLRVSVSIGNQKVLCKKTSMGPGGSTLGYLGYGPIQYNRDSRQNNRDSRQNETSRDAIDAGSTYHIVLRHNDPECVQEASNALELFSLFGGLGSRSRRGWGSAVLSTTGILTPTDLSNYISERVNSIIPSNTHRSASNLKWTAFGSDSSFYVSKEMYNTGNAALEAIGTVFKQFRHVYGLNKYGGDGRGPGPDYFLTKNALNGGEIPRMPERAAFGLPYAQVYRSLHSDRAEFVPNFPREGGGALQTTGRRASPVFLKIAKINGNRYVWVVLYLPAQFLPPGVSISAKTRNTTRLPLPGPFGIPGGQDGNSDNSRSTVPPNSTLVLEFMRRVDELAVPLPSRRIPFLATPPTQSAPQPRLSTETAATPAPPTERLPEKNDIVEVELVGRETSGKQRWIAKLVVHGQSPIDFAIPGNVRLPSTVAKGDKIRLRVAQYDPKNERNPIQVEWIDQNTPLTSLGGK